MFIGSSGERICSMCNKSLECLKDTDSSLDSQQMDSPSSVANPFDDAPRVKLLCSFLGSIMPRPQDGKLRYVGGETRIVSLPRDISYNELMSKMRELYDGASVLKYQQPDEDLDALVSVVNDDDVINMMEEYEKLGSGDGFTRLRIFLFPHPDPDGSLHYIDGDERDTERRYVDALNNLNDGAEFTRQLDSPMIGQMDDIHAQDSFFDCGMHGYRSSDMSMPQYNLRPVVVPRRYNEADGPWSPAYYSPRHHGGHLDPRTVSEFPNSPPSVRYRMQAGEFSDKCNERIPEELARLQLGHHPGYEHPPTFAENLAWVPSGVMPGDKAGFPGNLFHTPGCFEGNNSCEHCRVALQRNQPYLEQPSIGNGLPQAANRCSECSPNREALILNTDPKLHHGIYPKEQNDPRPGFNEALGQDRGWVMQHQPSPRADDARPYISGAGRFNDQYIADGPAMNYTIGPANYVDSHNISSNFVHHRAGLELGGEIFHDQAVSPMPHLHIGTPEDRSTRYGNYAFSYGTENLHPMTPGHLHAQTFWRNAQNPVLGTANAHEALAMTAHVNGTVNAAFLRATPEGSQRAGNGMDGHYPWAESSQQAVGFNGATTLDYNRFPPSKLSSSDYDPENRQIISSDHGRSPGPGAILPLPVNLGSQSHFADPSTVNPTEVAKTGRDISLVEKERNFSNHVGSTGIQVPDVLNIPGHEENRDGNSNVELTCAQTTYSNGMKHSEEPSGNPKEGEGIYCPILGDPNMSLSRLSFVPELIASIKKAALEEAGEVKAVMGKTCDTLEQKSGPREAAVDSEVVNAEEELELDSGNDNMNVIEPTKAEAEAIERGLQTIRNDDLEEIRELGSGTYGAVFHGKWKGSDVAIKRIKASCFTGKPSERERLIADFWKEALILSSLHHPNVVAFYGIVRDGPGGSLATVTEFMVNGSLKQFLQKKDRTIDRRKRLIIAMDAAFGMEYLHGKNIVHFDLKCENLLVNMRDPQRPICKIGDLGLSKVKQHTLVSGGVRGTLPWMAPELLSGKSHMVTEKIDVYSFAIVMWELLTGEEPYAGMHCASIIGGIVNNTLRPQSPTWCDPEWKALMESCWSSDPSERPSFSEISRKLRNMAAAINVK